MSTNETPETAAKTPAEIHILLWEENYGDEGSENTFIEAFMDKGEANKEARKRKPPVGFTGKNGDFEVLSIPLSRSSLEMLVNTPVR